MRRQELRPCAAASDDGFSACSFELAKIDCLESVILHHDPFTAGLWVADRDPEPSQAKGNSRLSSAIWRFATGHLHSRRSWRYIYCRTSLRISKESGKSHSDNVAVAAQAGCVV